MPADNFSLFDTPPGRREVQIAIIIVGLLLAASIGIYPIADTQWPAVPASIPVVEVAVLFGELIIAAVLYAQASIFRSRSLTMLASGYVFTALLLIPHALTFPGGIVPDGLFNAGFSTAAWLAVVRRLAYPLVVILYVLVEGVRVQAEPLNGQSPAKVPTGLMAACLLAVAVSVIVIAWGDAYFPPLYSSRFDVTYSNVAIINLLTIILCLGGMFLLYTRGRSVLDLWLLVALAVWLLQSVVNLPTHHRYTLGWYTLLLLMLVSNLVVLLALIAESNRLYAKLALTSAARSRERQADKMSIDAVAAAISHEVGQPLTALSLNASAAMASLRTEPPNVDKAIGAVAELQESARRTFDVLKSIRSMFSKEPGWAGDTNLNDVIEESLAQLQEEIAAAKISVKMQLDRDLPSMVANRVQLQHVVGNLLVNAIESLSSTRGRRRRIAISSTARGSHVLLVIADNGPSVSEDETWRVFDALQDNESDTKGIRLSLCRTIVEEHGGRIWVTPGEKQGSSFHVKLPIGG